MNVAAGLAMLVALAYCSTALWYTGSLNYFDPAEPSVTAVAAAFSAGQPLYPPLNAAERYAHVWGPALFLTHAAAMAFAGASIAASKAVGASAALLSLGTLFFVFRRYADASVAIVACGLCALVYLGFSNVTFWSRADPLLLLAVAVGLVGATQRRSTPAAVILGIAIGIAVNLKITGVFYLVPLFVVLHSSHGTRATAGAAGLTVALAIAPFLIPAVSFPNYVEYLQLSAKDGVVFQKVRQNLLWAAMLNAPLAVVWWRSRGHSQASPLSRATPALWVSMGIVALLGAKPGGGAFHLLPFVPVLAFACLTAAPSVERSRMSAWIAVLAVIMLVIAVQSQTAFIRTTAARQLGRVIQDLRRFADAEPGQRIAVGYAGTAYASYARPEIVFRTGEYWLDAQAVQEHRRAGLDLPAATLSRLEACAVEIWLVPRHGEAFRVPNAYFPDGPSEVFPAEFLEVFLRRYGRTGATEFFDIWRCRR